jgi:UDP-glucose:(heptosyl)LPS alpha-1,3-glucosyltransferase
MRVAVVVEWVDAWRGGAETSTMQFVHELIDQDVYVDLYTRSRLSSTPQMGVITVPVRSPIKSRQWRVFAGRAADIIRQHDYDVVHAISPCDIVDIYQPRGGAVAESVQRNIALRAQRTRSLKHFANRFNVKQRARIRYERDLARREPKPWVACVSRYVARQFEEHYRHPADKLRVIFNGVKQDDSMPEERAEQRRSIRQQYRVDDDHVLVILVAHNFKLKGVGNWIQTAGKLSTTGTGKRLHTLVIGKNHPGPLQRRVQSLGLNERFQFVGATQRVFAFLHAADILVHPTYFDPCSRVTLEGMTSGLPCITTRFDGSSELMTHGQSGFVIPDPNHIDQLADIVTKLAGDASLRTEIGRAAKTAAATATMARHTKQMIGLYQQIKSEKQSR